MYSRKPSKIEIFMIQISSENHLKYLGCGHVSAQNYSISIKFICLGVYIEVIKSVWSYVCIAMGKRYFVSVFRSRWQANEKWGLWLWSVNILGNVLLILVKTFWPHIIFEYTILGSQNVPDEINPIWSADKSTLAKPDVRGKLPASGWLYQWSM